MKYVHGPMTTEIMAPTLTMDSLCPLSPPLTPTEVLGWQMSVVDGRMRLSLSPRRRWARTAPHRSFEDHILSFCSVIIRLL